jgi:hypothetical protein
VRAYYQAGYGFIKVHGQESRDTYLAIIDEARRLGIRVVGHVPRRQMRLDETLAGGLAMIAHAEEFFYGYPVHFVSANMLSPPVEKSFPRDTLDVLVRLAAANHVAVTGTLEAYRTLIEEMYDFSQVEGWPQLRLVPEAGARGLESTQPLRLPTARSPANQPPQVLLLAAGADHALAGISGCHYSRGHRRSSSHSCPRVRPPRRALESV